MAGIKASIPLSSKVYFSYKKAKKPKIVSILINQICHPSIVCAERLPNEEKLQ